MYKITLCVSIHVYTCVLYIYMYICICTCTVCVCLMQGGAVETPGSSQKGLPQVLSQDEKRSQSSLYRGLHR